MATCLKPHSEARNSPSRPKFVFPRKKKRRNSNSHVKTEILLRLGLFSINVTPAQTNKHLIERSQNSSPSPIELLFSNSSPISFFQAEPRPTSSTQLWEALQSFHQFTPSHRPLLRGFAWPLCPPVLMHLINKVQKHLLKRSTQ